MARWNTGLLAAGITLAICMSAQAQSRPTTPRQLLAQAVDLYVEGRYKEAAEKLRPLVQSRALQDAADHKEALRAYGISLYLSGGQAGAERAFRDLLRLDPNEKLDPEFVRPEVLVFLEYVRNKYRTELNLVVKKKTSMAWVNVIPPWGQFQNGHRTKGALLLGGEVVFIATSLTTYFILRSWRGPTEEYLGHEKEMRPVQAVNIIATSLAIGLAIYGVADGFYYYYKTPFKQDAPKVGAMGHMSGPALPPTLIRF